MKRSTIPRNRATQGARSHPPARTSRSRSVVASVAFIAACAWGGAPATASPSLSTQSRSVHATLDGFSSWLPPTSFACLLGGFPVPGPWTADALLEATSFDSFDESAAVERAGATQNSTLGPTLMTAHGSADAEGAFEHDFGGGYECLRDATTTARSKFSVHFDIDAPTTFALDGTLSWEVGGAPIASAHEIELHGPDGLVAEIDCDLVELVATLWYRCDPTPEHIVGVLAAGQYRLDARVGATGVVADLGGPAFDTFGSGEFTVALQLTPAADVPGLGPLARLVLAAGLLPLGVSATMARRFVRRARSRRAASSEEIGV